MARAEYKIRKEDFIPFSGNYEDRLIRLRSSMGTEKYNREVRGLYTKAAGIGLMAYNIVIMTLPLLIDAASKGLEGTLK